MRDLRSVGAKLKIVLNPRGNQEGVLTKLKDCKLKMDVPGCIFLRPYDMYVRCTDVRLRCHIGSTRHIEVVGVAGSRQFATHLCFIDILSV